MARRAVRPRVSAGPGYGWMIFFIVLCVALMSASGWLYMTLVACTDAINAMNTVVETTLNQPFGSALALQTQPPAEKFGTRFGVDFYKGLAEAIRKGIEYDKVRPKLGWPGEPVEALARYLDQEMLRVKPPAPNINTLCEERTREVNDLNTRLKSTQTRAQEAIKARDNAVKSRKHTQKLMADMKAAAEQKLVRQTAHLNREVARYKRELDKMSKLRQAAWNQFEMERSEHRKSNKKFQDQLAKLNEKIGDLQILVDKKYHTPVKVAYAQVLRADPVNQFIILDRGGRDGIEVGEDFDIIRMGKGGQPIKKGLVRVVRVDELTSTADVLDEQPLSPIIAGDKARRHKKFAAPYEVMSVR